MKKACENKKLAANYRIPHYVSFIYTHILKSNKEEALKYYEMAYQSNSSMKFLLNAVIRTKAQLALKRKKSLVNKEHATLYVLFQEWKKSRDEMQMASSLIPDLQHRLLDAIQVARKSDPNNDKINKTIKNVKQKIFANSHLCENCLHSYAAGDKFCADCGNKVKVYGVCSDCGEVLSGHFCSKCGKKQ
ncbi:MAG: zinc ribbon domain-containing protein [Verrucomicrobiota bacterium]|nr:zinc ribbon domain-containing protein [Verrucomicrobiota bacterium]